jgi:hypothetical protein
MLISADTIHYCKAETVAINVQFILEIASKIATDPSGPPDASDMPFSEFSNWHINISDIYQDLFRQPIGVPLSSRHDFRILTDPLAKAPHQQLYRQSLAEKEAYKSEICKLVENSWVAASCSHFAVPIIFVKKGDGKLCMCMDYRDLNTITARDRYTMPYINDLLDKLHRSRYFTKMDLSSGYYQLGIHSAD